MIFLTVWICFIRQSFLVAVSSKFYTFYISPIHSTKFFGRCFCEFLYFLYFSESQTTILQFKNNYLCSYDLYSSVHNVLNACISITRASGRGLGPGIREFFGPCEMASIRYACAIWGPKNSALLRKWFPKTVHMYIPWSAWSIFKSNNMQVRYVFNMSEST